jgi:hypothetical protein
MYFLPITSWHHISYAAFDLSCLFDSCPFLYMLHASDVKLSNLKSLLIEIYVSLMLWYVLYLAPSVYYMIASYMELWMKIVQIIVESNPICIWFIRLQSVILIFMRLWIIWYRTWCTCGIGYGFAIIYHASYMDYLNFLGRLSDVTNSTIWFHCTYSLFSCLSALFWKITHVLQYKICIC